METNTLAVVTARSRPPHPAFCHGWPWPRTDLIGAARHSIKRLVLRAVDQGWFGLHPLQTHVSMCGFQRSGSTLLQLMVETCVSDVRTFGKEYWAPAAAQFALRNHSYMLTKTPWDIFFVEDVRSFYATRPARVRFVVTVRDPRAVLTSSIHDAPVNHSDGYFVVPERWVAYYEHVRYAQQFDDVMTVEYQDIVCQPALVQKRLEEFIGWHVHLPFERFHDAVPPAFERTNLNGLRPLDPTRVEGWRQEKHRERIRRILREIPQLPDCLIETGYETDTNWVRDYL
jgi:hypothetical protein